MFRRKAKPACIDRYVLQNFAKFFIAFIVHLPNPLTATVGDHAPELNHCILQRLFGNIAI